MEHIETCHQDDLPRFGKLADLSIISGHITDLANESYNLDVGTTICDGEVVYMKHN
jgi:predicted amidohydrolase YtcJ